MRWRFISVNKKICTFIFRMSEINREQEIFGTSNEVDLMLCRGAGEFSINWLNQETKQKILQRYICASHLEEFRAWNRTQYRHVIKRRITGIMTNVCSVPTDFGPSHEAVHENLEYLERHEAEYVLDKLGVLLPIGLRELDTFLPVTKKI